MGEVNSGQWYNVAYQNLITDPEKGFLCPIILANDKTTISEMGDLHVDAIFMTTSIFNTKVRIAKIQHLFCKKILIIFDMQTRNKASAWRVIAYIPREKNYTSQTLISKFPSALKTFRMQQLYKAAISNLVDAQKPGALSRVRLQLGNMEKQVNLKIPIMFIIGDNQGGDTICGQIVHYGKTARRICRTCNAKPN